ncbi:CC0125/CC1285 family lipoprotein [Paraburkholderia phenoliruptrix]|uniref:Lipoprotein n=2 Tax=Paraburkholderia phenoliruptrix TaxID=252970 RepID=A0A6J5KCJ0_9BURK|nr:hypothetical protein [Paraburkholderia phenoliruptrix]MDR6422775.1 hypothetical protein [Paraburkholderia phenoliruptrix]CAB4051600.1 hypothetical protein LMG9964_05279 [Paraburkholderia phenoliruptrix]
MNLNIKRTLLGCVVLAATATLMGCVTSYKPFGVAGGYKDRQIDDQTLHVEFSGNGYTSRDTVHKYFMYRCAELTQQHGFRYFMVIPTALSGAIPATGTLVRSGGFDRTQMRKVHGYVPIIIYSGGNTGVRYFSDSADIRMFNDDAVITTKVAGWDAAEVVEQLGPFVHSTGRTAADVPKAWVFEPGHPKVRAEDLLPSAPKNSTGSGV